MIIWGIVPLGIIGAWRWGMWLYKKIVGWFYRPNTTPFQTSVSVVTPVYNENPDTFLKALQSWRCPAVIEIIAVIDYTDERCIRLFQDFAKTWPGARLIVTHTPGKRPALADGIQIAQGEVISLVDSDTLWEGDVPAAALPPFRDPRVGGVTTRQNVLTPRTLAEHIFDIQLDLRYGDELPFLMAGGGDTLACLSGRTALYRRQAIIPLVDGMLHETFWGQPVISGEDKRLTYLLEESGWKVAYQSTAQVYTPGVKTLSSLLQQRLRWGRNSWRADLRALAQRWIWRRPIFALYQIDRIAQAFTTILSPLFFMFILVSKEWRLAAIIVGWWLVSRAVRLYPHLKRYPGDIVLVPIYVVINFYMGLVRLYALCTLHRQGWITRWDKSRLPTAARLQVLPGYGLTALMVVGLGSGAWGYRQANPVRLGHQPVAVVAVTEIPGPVTDNLPVVGTAVLARSVIAAGDSLATLAKQYQRSVADIVRFNSPWLPSQNHLTPGVVLTIPQQSVDAGPPYGTGYRRPGPLRIGYSAATNTIEVGGRGQVVTLRQIRAAVGTQYLNEESPGQWYLQANLHLNVGVNLTLHQPEVHWLKIKSTPNGFMFIRATTAQLVLDGVKITSWDATTGAVDAVVADGRSFIAATKNSRLDISRSELAYLGYAPPPEQPVPTYGVAWQDSTGETENSRLHHNYDGAYASGAFALTWRHNTVTDNLRYGLDLYGESRQSLVENNTVSGNGRHGIILAVGSTGNLIQDNQVHDNALHGIMLFKDSNNNEVRRNEVFNQHDGIVVYAASGNRLRANYLHHNQQGIRANHGSQRLTIVDNTLHDIARTGIRLYDGAVARVMTANTVKQ